MTPLLMVAGALLASTPPEPVDPAFEVALLDLTFDQEVCDEFGDVVPLLGAFLDDYQLAADMLIAYGVEAYEDGYGQNLTEEGEAHLEELLWGCM